VSEVVTIFQTYLLAITLMFVVLGFGKFITFPIGKKQSFKGSIEQITSNLLGGLAGIATLSTLAATAGLSLKNTYITIGILSISTLIWSFSKQTGTLSKEITTAIFGATFIGLWGVLPAIYFSARNGSGLTMIAKGNNDVANYAAVATEFLGNGFKNTGHYPDFNLNEFALRSDYRGPTSLIAAFSAMTNLKTWQILTAVIVFVVGFAVLGLISFLTQLFDTIRLHTAVVISFIVYSSAIMIYIQTNYFLAQIFASGIIPLIFAHFISQYRYHKQDYQNFDFVFLNLVSMFFYPHLLIPIFLLSLFIYIVFVLRDKNILRFLLFRNLVVSILVSVFLAFPYMEYLFAFIMRQLGASTAGWPLPFISLPGLLFFPQLIGVEISTLINSLIFIASIWLIIHFRARQMTVSERNFIYTWLIFTLITLSLLAFLPGRNSSDYSFWKMESYLFPITFSLVLVLLINNRKIGQGVMFVSIGAVVCIPTVSWIGNSFYGMYVSKDLSDLGSSKLISRQSSLNLKLQPYFETMAAGTIIEGPVIRNLSEGYWPVSKGVISDCTLVRIDDPDENYIFKINNTFGLTDRSLSGCGATQLNWESGKRIYFSNSSWSKLGTGWSMPEEWGTWTNGKVAILNLPAGNYTKGFQIEFESMGFLSSNIKSMKVTVFINKTKLGEIKHFKSGIRNFQIISIPPQSLSTTEKYLTLTFYIEKPISPAEVSSSSDTRELGIGLISVRKILLGVN
jgi:hypothetical protein